LGKVQSLCNFVHVLSFGRPKEYDFDMTARQIKNGIRRFFKRRQLEPPEDPYAYVGAPKKPRPPYRSAAAAAEPER
jgi:hypothetical protein